MIGVRDGKLTLRCVWYPSTGAAADGKSLLPLMSKSFIQNSPLQELVYTWRGTFFAHPHHAYLTRCSTRSLPYVLAFFSLRRSDERLYFARCSLDVQTRHYIVPLTRSAFLFQPPVLQCQNSHQNTPLITGGLTAFAPVFGVWRCWLKRRTRLDKWRYCVYLGCQRGGGESLCSDSAQPPARPIAGGMPDMERGGSPQFEEISWRNLVGI